MAERVEAKTPWSSNVAELVSFDDVMAEQLQEKFVEENVNAFNDMDLLLRNSEVFEDLSDSQDCSRDFELACLLSADPDCSSDLELATKLQREFDREMELNEKFRQTTLSADSYHYMHEDEESSDEEQEDEDLRKFAIDLLYNQTLLEFPPCGFLRSDNGTIITKHDRELNSLKNGVKAMQLDICTGNGTVERLSDRVLNELRLCSKVENRKNIRIKDKDEKATNASSVDTVTRLILIKWINSGEFDRIEGVIAMGKESTVLHAISNDKTDKTTENLAGTSLASEEVISVEAETCTSDDDVVVVKSRPEFAIKPLNRDTSTSTTYDGNGFAIKVYKTSLSSFRNRSEYVKDDFRFKNPRRVMKIWAEREFMNLNRLRRANIKCPTAIRLRKHVLLMSLIGHERQAAPKLKDIEFPDMQSKLDAFQQIISRMFNKCNLVHADLSEFNLLWNDGVIYVIDVAQAMDTSHPRALAFLLKDIINILNFFGRIDTESLPSVHELFTEITQLDAFDPEKNLSAQKHLQIENFECENSLTKHHKAHPADMELRLCNAENKDCPMPLTD